MADDPLENQEPSLDRLVASRRDLTALITTLPLVHKMSIINISYALYSQSLL